jgi:NADH-quinone oxidoreductase subunit M
VTYGFPLLTVLVLLPAAGAALLALWRGASRRTVETVGAAVTMATLGFAIAVVVAMSTRFPGFQFVSGHAWVQTFGISWYVGADGISVFLVLLAAVLFPLALLGARSRGNPRAFVAWMLLLEAACIGSFVSLDLILFFFFFELTLVPAYFLISGWGHERRAYAAIKFFVYTFLGSAFLLVGILATAYLYHQQHGVWSFSLIALEHTHFTSTQGILLFCAFTAAFAVKAPLFPFHTWSPDAYGEAPAAASVILAGVLAKLGTYGIIRFDLTLFPHASRTLAPIMLTLAVIGILYGSIVACAQRDLKRLVAYSSLAQIGFIALATFAFTGQALSGGVLMMVNHGLIVGGLFLLIAWLYERRRSHQVTEMRGLQASVPLMAAAFTVVMLASIGLPGLNNFVSEFLVLSGTFLTHRWWAVVATFGVVLAALYLLWAYQQVFQGPPDEEAEPSPVAAEPVAVSHGPGAMAAAAEPVARSRDLTWAERLVIAPLLALIVLLGVFPQPVLNRINPTVNHLVACVEASAAPSPATHQAALRCYGPPHGVRP